MEFKEFFELQECVIAAVKLNNDLVLAKNRDRGYIAKIEVVHELISGTEVVFWKDVDTDWSEGMNSYGIGIINSSLLVKQDEKEGKRVLNGARKPDATEKKIAATDGKKIRKALSYTNIKDVLDSISGKKKNGINDGLKGHTIISDGKDVYVLEMTSKHDSIIKKLDDKIVVRTNHGIYHKNIGYTHGRKKESSHSRMRLAQEHLLKAKKPQDVLDILKEKYVSDPFLNPYRRTSPWTMHTTGQILLDLKNLQVTIRMDKDEGKFKGIINKLPKHYDAKIKIKIEH